MRELRKCCDKLGSLFYDKEEHEKMCKTRLLSLEKMIEAAGKQELLKEGNVTRV